MALIPTVMFASDPSLMFRGASASLRKDLVTSVSAAAALLNQLETFNLLKFSLGAGFDCAPSLVGAMKSYCKATAGIPGGPSACKNALCDQIPALIYISTVLETTSQRGWLLTFSTVFSDLQTFNQCIVDAVDDNIDECFPLVHNVSETLIALDQESQQIRGFVGEDLQAATTRAHRFLNQKLSAGPSGPPLTTLVYYLIETFRGGVADPPQRGGSPGGVLSDWIFPAASRVTVTYFDPIGMTYAVAFGDTASPGLSTRLASVPLRPIAPNDQDGDGIPDLGELVLGTRMDRPDSDGDGLNDLAEVLAGSNPLDGTPAATGIIATAEVDGDARDLCATNDILAVAALTGGVSVYNIFQGMSPTLLRVYPTAAEATALACQKSDVAVMAGSILLLISDLDDVQEVSLPAPGMAVEMVGDLVVAGLNSGQVGTVDLRSQLPMYIPFFHVQGPIQDLKVTGGFLYILTGLSVTSVKFVGGVFSDRATAAVSTQGRTPKG